MSLSNREKQSRYRSRLAERMERIEAKLEVLISLLSAKVIERRKGGR